MKHKTWFRLVIKAIGVLLIGLSLPSTFLTVMRLGYLFSDEGWATANSFPLWWNLGSALAPALQFLCGVYLLFGGKWIVNKIIPSNRPYCPECGYDLSESRGERCPECGIVLPPEIMTASQREAANGQSLAPNP